MLRPRRLRVAVPAALTRLPAHGGHGKVWRQLLAELGGRARVTVAERPPRRAPDAWLVDAGAPLPERLGAPLVAVVHEAPWDEPAARAVLDPAFVRAVRDRTQAAVDVAARVVTPAESGRAQIVAAHGADPARVDVVPYGVDLAVFRPGAGAGARTGRDTVAPPDAAPPRVLFVGSVHPRKNLPALREAMAALRRDGRPHELALVVSPAPDRRDSSALLAQAAAPLDAAGGTVILRAPTDADLARHMAAARAVCLPSLSEGFGLPVLEAMACAAPVVTTTGGALPEVAGDGALLCAPSAEALAGALARVLEDERLAADLRRRGRARAEQLPWSRTADGVLATLERAVRERG